MPTSFPASEVTTTSPSTTNRMYYTHAVNCCTPAAIPSFAHDEGAVTSSTHPFASGRLEIAPTHSRIIEMEEAIQLVDDKHPFLDSVSSDDEPDTDVGIPVPGPSRPKYASSAVIYLRSYLRGAQLPELFRASATSPYADVPFPLGNPIKRNLLAISSHQKRKISQFEKFSQEMLIKATKLYLLEKIYGSEDFITMINTGVPAPSPDEALTLQSYIGSRNIAPEETISVRYPRHLPGLIEWLDNYPLRTLTRAIHLANPSTTRWWFDRISPQELGEDFVRNKSTLAVLGWRFHPDTANRPWFKEIDDEMGWVAEEEEGTNFLKVHPHQKPWFIPSPEVSLAIIVQPPWILSWEDLKSVAECRDLPELTDPAVDPSKHYTMAQRVWCQIRDACQKSSTKYFILTTYEGWLFGKFGGGRGGSGYIPSSRSPIREFVHSSKRYCQRMKIAPWAFNQWTYVETSEIFSSKALNPTIMQVLYFWTARSMALKKSREVALELRLPEEEIGTVERSITHPPEVSAKRLPYYETYEFQHHTGNRRRSPRTPSRFAPYSGRPSRKVSDETSPTGLLSSFIKSLSKYFTGTGQLLRMRSMELNRRPPLNPHYAFKS